ncbi:MAG: sensor histidine kinase, partial [Candidatus Binataceae bacterium]
DLDHGQCELLSAIQEDVAGMRDLANNLLELARGQAAITVQTMPVDLVQLVRSVSRTFALQAEQKHVSLSTSFEEPRLPMRGDPLKLSWVVSNLIANALRYTPAGGAISISSIKTGAMIQLIVSDNGPGIAPQLRGRLFERFAQWNVNGAESGSAGLGLAIVREIVEAHGGRIFVDSTPGKGASFTVELPGEPEDLWQSS